MFVLNFILQRLFLSLNTFKGKDPGGPKTNPDLEHCHKPYPHVSI